MNKSLKGLTKSGRQAKAAADKAAREARMLEAEAEFAIGVKRARRAHFVAIALRVLLTTAVVLLVASAFILPAVLPFAIMMDVISVALRIMFGVLMLTVAHMCISLIWENF